MKDQGWQFVRHLLISILVTGLASACFPRPTTSENEKSTDVVKSPTPIQGVQGEWPFDDPKNRAVITVSQVLDGRSIVRYVTHDKSDGAWQFLDGGNVAEADARVVGLSEMIALDPTLMALADLPLGWYAERSAQDSPWKRGSQ
jgi:hypothetical protein